MKIGTIGYNYRHDMRTENFDLDRPAGPGAPLMLLIKTPLRFWIKGDEFTVKANSFVLFNSDTPCRYTGEGDCYTDDWIYFDMTAEDFEYLEKLGISTDTVVHIGSLDELSQLVHILAFEHYSANSFHDEIEQQYIKILKDTDFKACESDRTEKPRFVKAAQREKLPYDTAQKRDIYIPRADG